jgi:protein TonB
MLTRTRPVRCITSAGGSWLSRARRAALTLAVALAAAACTITPPDRPLLITPPAAVNSATLDQYRIAVARRILDRNPSYVLQGTLQPMLRSLVVVSFTVDRDGQVLQSAVYRTNGDDEAESTALATLRRASSCSRIGCSTTTASSSSASSPRRKHKRSIESRSLHAFASAELPCTSMRCHRSTLLPCRTAPAPSRYNFPIPAGTFRYGCRRPLTRRRCAVRPSRRRATRALCTPLSGRCHRRHRRCAPSWFFPGTAVARHAGHRPSL